MHTDLDDARLIVAQLMYLLEHVRPGEGEVDVPSELTDLGPVEISPDGVRRRMETLMAGASRALLALLDVAAEAGIGERDALQQVALRLAAADQPG